MTVKLAQVDIALVQVVQVDPSNLYKLYKLTPQLVHGLGFNLRESCQVTRKLHQVSLQVSCKLTASYYKFGGDG